MVDAHGAPGLEENPGMLMKLKSVKKLLIRQEQSLSCKLLEADRLVDLFYMDLSWS